mgnify:CR=1 FL=1
MAIKPILFNKEMVRAILDGRKTCTRRIIKAEKVDNVLNSPARKSNPDIPDAQFIKCLVDMKYEPGDILYVRETWYKSPLRYMYRANYFNTEQFYTDGKEVNIKWHPSIHMPKEAARIWLKVTDVRVERLQEITGQDVLKEGLNSHVHPQASYFDGNQREMFEKLWNSTIKKSDIDRYGWDASPYVLVIEFERCEKPENL